MSQYPYAIAKDVLSETDKNRILAIYLSMENPNSTTDWAKATAEFGSASEESMKVSVRNALRKVDKAVAGGATPAAGNGGTPKAKGGRKRKSPSGDGDADEGKPKARKPRAKKAKGAPVVDDDDDAAVGADIHDHDGGMEENIIVKQEDEGVEA